MGQRTPLNLLPGAKGYQSPVAATVRPNASDVVFQDFTTGLAPGGYKAGLGKSGVAQPTATTTKTRTTSRVSTKPGTAKATTQSMKAPPLLVPAAPLEVPEVANAGNVNLNGLAANGVQLYSSGYSGASDPFNAFRDYGFEPTSAGTMGGTGSAAYTPGVYTPGATDARPEFFKANPEGQYTNMAGEGTVSLADAQNGMNWDMGDIAKGVEAASGLANAYLGYKNYGLAKDQFGFTKALANRNIANQASEYNTGLQNAGEVGMSLAGNTMDPAARAARQAQLTSQKISGAPIG